MMPRDVSTRWNSTYDMLKFALEYRTALDTISGEREMKLREYELNDKEWAIARQLQDILEVCTPKPNAAQLTIFLAFEACYALLFSCNTEHRDGHPCYGPSGSTPGHERP
jgi:hypothetical protein